MKAFVEQSYADAGYTPDDIDTGAVVITGEALKKENAQPILEMFSEESGRFICATAGPMHEALLAAYGSGAVAMSKHHHNSVLDVDVGGGTTKISLIQGGEITQMIAVEVGARLIAYDDAMTVTRVEQPARTIMRALGHTVEVGDRITPERIEEFAQKMTDVLFDVIEGGDLDSLTESLMLTEGLREHSGRDIDHLMFSGGVSEYIYDREATTFGDIGPAYGAAVRHRTQATFNPGVMIAAAEGIRATVIGAGEYTLQASGSTCYISTADVLPVRGIQVAHALIDKEQTPKQMSDALSNALGKYDVGYLNGDMALALNVTGQPDYWYIRRLAESIANIVDPAGEPAAPLFLVLDVDVAKSLGGIMRERAQDRPLGHLHRRHRSGRPRLHRHRQTDGRLRSHTCDRQVANLRHPVHIGLRPAAGRSVAGEASPRLRAKRRERAGAVLRPFPCRPWTDAYFRCVPKNSSTFGHASLAAASL